MAKLIAWWRCDGNADDSVGDLDGTATASLVTGRNGEANTAYDLETGYIQCDSSSILDIENHTICFWFKLTGHVVGWKLFFDWHPSAVRSPSIWRHDSTRRLHWMYYPGNLGFGNLGITGENGTEFSDGVWYWVAVSKKGTVATAFVNGVNVGTMTVPCPKQAGSYAISFGDVVVKMHIADIRIYDDAISLKEARDIYHDKIAHWTLDNTGTDCSGHGNDGTVTGGAFSTDVVAIGSGSWQKTADANVIATSLLVDSQNVTYSFWFRTTGTGGTLSEAVLGNRSSSNGFMFYRNDGNTDTQFHALKYYTTTTPSQANILRTSSYTADTWHHVVCAYDEDGNYKIFNNGTKAHYGTASLFDYWDDGVTFDVGHDGAGGYISYRGWTDDIQIFNTYLSDADCIALHEERASLDNEGNLHGVEFVETKYQPFLTNYTVWEDGQTGSVGSFNQNGTTSENSRENGTGPFGNTIPLWKATPDAVSDNDGGWNHSDTLTDKTKCYRYSVWIKRTGNSNGTTYLGCRHSNVKNIVTSVVDTNPYFWAGDPTNYTDWFLWVGHIRPYDTDETTHHPDTGIWDTDGVKVQSMTNDYKWIDGTVYHRHRSYLFYCTDIANRQYWAYPRIDVCDGTEPTLADLIGGLDGRYFDYVNSLNGTTAQPMSITSSQVLISNMSEVGAVDGLVAWYPLNGDAVDLVGDNDGVVTDATIVEGNKDLAYNFNGTIHKIEVVDDPALEPSINLSVSFWFKMDTWSSLRQILCVKWYGYSCEIGTDQKMYFRVYHVPTTSTDSPKTTNIVSTGVWHHFVGTYNTSAGVSMYFDNVDYGTTATTGAITYDANPLRMGRYSDALRLLGDLRDVRIYDKVLSVEEVGMLYATTGGTTTRMTQTSNTVAVKSGFNEV